MRAQLLEPAVGPEKSATIDLHVVTVEGEFRRVGLAKDEIPPAPTVTRARGPLPLSMRSAGAPRTSRLKASDAVGGAGADVELNVGQGEGDRAETVRVRDVTMDAIAPRRDGLDSIVAFSEIEAASGERLARLGQTIEQRLASGSTRPVIPRRTSIRPVGRWN